MVDDYSKRVKRNIGILTPEQQEKLRLSKVAIAGCGADGGAPAITLARLGVRDFCLADPDNFDFSNMNRQEGAIRSNIGSNKAQIIAKNIHDIDPNAEVRVFEEGINTSNISTFGDHVDVIIEEIDYHNMVVSEMIYDFARKNNIPVISGISVGWRAYGFYFDPCGYSFKKYVKITSEKLNQGDLSSAPFVPEIPSYIDRHTVKDVLLNKLDIPVIDPAVKLSAALVSMLFCALITGNRNIKPVPAYYSSGDLLEAKESIMRL